MDNQFQMTAAQYGDIQAKLGSLVAHQHLGTDSLQLDPKNFLNQRFYGLISKVTLTSAQVLALTTTPIQLVPAPLQLLGTPTIDALNIVDSIDTKLAYNGTAYTGANNLEFRYTNGAGTKVTADMSSTFLNSAATSYDHVAGVVTELIPTKNAKIVVSVPTANPGAGNSTLIFIIKYRVVTF